MVINDLYKKAKKTLEANILKYPEASFVTAGGNQFKTLWVRDFCYSVPGLLALDYAELVKNQLQFILKYRHQNGFLPRGLDVVAPQLRVVLNLLFKELSFYKYPTKFSDFKTRIKPEYLGEHKTVAFDSNILFVWAYLKYVEKTSDRFVSEDLLLGLLTTYRSYYSEGLFTQPPFSDWQDSACRSESMLLFQIQFLSVLKKLEPAVIEKLKFVTDDNLSTQILAHYFDEKSYRFFQDKPKKQMSLELYGFIFSENLFPQLDKTKLYSNLKSSPLWAANLVPGVPVYPPYSGVEISWTTKAVGLGGYHDSFHWGWLIAESVKIAIIAGDYAEAQRVEEFFYNATKNNDYLAEIYMQNNQNLRVFKNFLYQSEMPFTWTAAKWIEALSYK